MTYSGGLSAAEGEVGVIYTADSHFEDHLSFICTSFQHLSSAMIASS